MIPCLECHRHIREDEDTCPFCGSGHGQVGAPWWQAFSALLVGALALGTSACATDDTSVSTSASGSETVTTTGSGTETGATSTETDTGDETNDSADTSLSFYAPAEDFDLPTECDPFLQDCPEGEKCVPYGSTGGNWDANKCVPIMGGGQPGDSCHYGGVVEATDDCDETSHCWEVMDVGGENIGTCTAFCMGSADDPECPEGSSCLVGNNGSITLCIQSCDPLLQECDTGLGCFWNFNDAFSCIFTTEELPTGETCGFVNDCAPGNLCVSEESLIDCAGQSCCAAYCDVEAPDPCEDPNLSCVAMFDQGGPAGFEHVGVCIAPP